jgi:hypothetical protein
MSSRQYLSVHIPLDSYMTLLRRLNLYRHGRTLSNMVTTIGCAIMYLLASAHCGLNFWRMSDVIKAQLTVQGGNLEEWVRPYSTELTTLMPFFFFFSFQLLRTGALSASTSTAQGLVCSSSM